MDGFGERKPLVAGTNGVRYTVSREDRQAVGGPKGKPQPEDTMSLTQSVAQMLRERVTLEVESIDRLVRRVSGRSRA